MHHSRLAKIKWHFSNIKILKNNIQGHSPNINNPCHWSTFEVIAKNNQIRNRTWNLYPVPCIHGAQCFPWDLESVYCSCCELPFLNSYSSVSHGGLEDHKTYCCCCWSWMTHWYHIWLWTTEYWHRYAPHCQPSCVSAHTLPYTV